MYIVRSYSDSIIPQILAAVLHQPRTEMANGRSSASERGGLGGVGALCGGGGGEGAGGGDGGGGEATGEGPPSSAADSTLLTRGSCGAAG